MTYKIEKIPNQPIMIVNIYADYSVREHQPLSDAEAGEILDKTDKPLYHIIDVTDFKLSFDDILAASNTGARGENAMWQHPNNKMLIFISPSPIVKMGVSGLGSTAFGNIDARAFSTREQALTWIRNQS